MQKAKKIFDRNKEKILFLVFLYAGVTFLFDVFAVTPYLSLLTLSSSQRIIMLSVVFLVLISPPVEIYIFLAITFSFLAGFSLLLGQGSLAEAFGNIIFVLLALWLVFGLVDYFKELKK